MIDNTLMRRVRSNSSLEVAIRILASNGAESSTEGAVGRMPQTVAWPERDAFPDVKCTDLFVISKIAEWVGTVQ